MHYELPAFLACLVISAFFSGSETALMSASRLKLQRLTGEGDERAAAVLQLVRDPRGVLAGILVGNNLVNFMAASIATPKGSPNCPELPKPSAMNAPSIIMSPWAKFTPSLAL